MGLSQGKKRHSATLVVKMISLFESNVPVGAKYVGTNPLSAQGYNTTLRRCVRTVISTVPCGHPLTPHIAHRGSHQLNRDSTCCVSDIGLLQQRPLNRPATYLASRTGSILSVYEL